MIISRTGFLLLCLFVLPFSALPADKSVTEQQLKTLRARISGLQEKQQELQKKESEARQALATAERASGEALNKLKQTRGHLSQARKRLQNLDNERRRFQQQRDQAQRALAEQVRAAYLAGRDEYWKMLLSQRDANKLGRNLTYYDYLNKARTREITRLTEASTSLATVQQHITDEINQLRHLETTQDGELKKLKKARDERNRALAIIQRDVKDEQKRLNALLEDERNLTGVLSRVEAVVKEIKLPKNAGFAQLKGKLGWPTRGNLLQKFGDDRFQGRMRWNGVLISAKEGSEVNAVFHGRVVFSDWLRGFGLMTIIDHGDGYMSLYGHNQSLGKNVGDWVEAGEVIASAGNSGGATDSALYFEIRYKGKAQDPRLWCKRG